MTEFVTFEQIILTALLYYSFLLLLMTMLILNR